MPLVDQDAPVSVTEVSSVALNATPWSIGFALTAAIAQVVLYKAQAFSLKSQCARPRAREMLIAINVLSLTAAIIGGLASSMPLLLVSLGLTVGFDLTSAPVLSLTGGPDRVCALRRGLQEVFTILERKPLLDTDVAEAMARLNELNWTREPMTERVLDAVADLLRGLTPIEQDRLQTIRAYDEIDAALAELKVAQPW